MKLRYVTLTIGTAALAAVLAACSSATTGGGGGSCTPLAASYDTATTLPAGCYTAAGDVNVNAALTLDPGVVITMSQNTGIWVGQNIGNVGSLHANGTPSNPIVIKGNGTPGYWADINIYSADSQNLLNYVHVTDAGESGDGDVYVDANASVTITNSLIENSGGYGVYLYDPTSQLPGFSSNTITGNALGAMYILANQMSMLDTATDYSGNTVDDVEVGGGTVTSAATWPAINVPFFASSDISVNAAVTVSQGMTMRLAQYTGLWIGQNGGNFGSLHAVGSAAQPISFVGNGSQGYWSDINFYSNDSANELSYVNVEGAGSVGDGDVYIGTNAQVTVMQSLLSDSGGYGICESDTTSVLHLDPAGDSNTYTNDVYGAIGSPNTGGC